MRAVGVHEYGPPEALQLIELPDPTPGPGELRIRTYATTVNPTDTLLRSGLQAELMHGRTKPFRPGMELAGVVDTVGEDAGDWKPGDRVFAITTPVIPTGGAYAELVVVPTTSVARIPSGMGYIEATTIPMNGLTVQLAFDLLEVQPGQTLGITGAAGVVGGYAIEMGVQLGLKIVAQTSRKDADAVLRLGASHWVDRAGNWAEDMRTWAGDGVDALLDAAVVGGPVVGALADGGRIAAVRPFEGDVERGITVHQVGVRQYLHRSDVLEKLGAMAAEGKLTLRVGRVFRPDEVIAAHRLLEAGGHRGRIVIDWGTP